MKSKSVMKREKVQHATKKAPKRSAKATAPKAPTTEKVLVLRTCKSDLTSTDAFQWPERGSVKAPDWDSTPECGHGLHGWLWGEGDGSLGDFSPEAKWLVVEVLAKDIVDLKGKVKFPFGTVVFCGDRKGATDYLGARAPGKAIIGGTATAGDWGTASAGDSGTATAGYGGTATAGDWGTASAGDSGTATAGYGGTATAGDWGTASAGNSGTASAGTLGTASAGDSGTATAGNSGTASAGDSGTASAGDSGTATAGYKGTLQIHSWDGRRYRIHTFYVGEDGIEANVAYKLDANNKAVRA